MTPTQLERYAFLWSEARLCIAAVALFLNGVPPVRYILPAIPITWAGLIICWIISGLVSIYLAYRYINNGQKLFGHNDPWDRAAFWVNVITGLNLGFAGAIGVNIGMQITHNYIVFVIVGLVYLISANHLYRRYRANGNRIF